MLFIGLSALFTAVLFKFKYKYIFNPATLFMLLWGFILTLYSARLYGLYTISDKTLTVYAIGLFCFTLGNFSFFKKRKVRLEYSLAPHYHLTSNKKNILIIFAIISIVIFGIYAMQMIRYWNIGGVHTVKAAGVEGFIQVDNYIEILYTYLATPIQFLSVLVIIINILFDKENISKILILLSIIMFVLKYICTASKFAVVLPVVIILISVLYKSALRKTKFKHLIRKLSLLQKIIIIVITIIIILFIVNLLSSSRNWMESLYYYLVGCVPCSDHAIKTLESNNIQFYGAVSFNGVLRMFNSFIRLIGTETPWSVMMDEAYQSILTFEKAINITPTVKYNAFISCFSYFFSDGGFFGVAILSFFFGRYAKITYERFIRKQDLYHFIQYILCCYVILTSMVRFQFFVITLPLVYLYTKLIFGLKNICFK